MAKKNIQITYTVNDSALTASAKAIKDNEKAANDADAAVKKYGQDAQKTGNTIGMTYVELRAKMLALKDTIENVSTSDKKRLNELTAQYKVAKQQVDDFNKSLQTGTNASALAIQNLGKVATAVFTVAIIKQTAGAVLEMAKLKGITEGVKAAFDKLPGSAVLFQQIKNATHGALSDLEIMQKVLQAKNFGIPLENLAQLFEYAAIKSQQTGISIEYLTESIVLGLGRESVKILDNLQIDIGKLRDRMKETGQSFRVVASEMINEELIKMGGYIDTDETKVNELNTAFKNLKITLAGKISSSGLLNWITDVINTNASFIKGGFGQATKDKQRASAENAFQEDAKNLKTIADVMAYINRLQNNVAARNITIFENQQKVQAMLNKPGGLQHSDDAEREFLMAHTKSLREDNEATRIKFELAQKYIETIAPTDKVVEKQTITIKSLTEQIKDLNEQLIENTSIYDTEQLRAIEAQISRLGKMKEALLALYTEPEEKKFKKPTVDTLQGDANLANSGMGILDADVGPSAALLNKWGLLTTDQITLQIGKDLALLHNNNEAARETKRKADEQLAIWRNEADEEYATELRKQQQKKQLAQQTFQYGAQLIEQLLMMSINSQQETFQREKGNFDQRLQLAGDNQEARIEIEKERDKFEEEQDRKQAVFEKEQARRQKEIQIKQMVIQNISNAIRALGEPPVPNFALSGLTLGFGLAQIVAAKAIGFKEGVIGLNGPGTGTSDSIPARLSVGESVITAKATERSHDLLEAINDGRIDDRILRKLSVTNGGTTIQYNNKELIKELKAMKETRYDDGHFTMREIQKGENFKIRMKAKYRS